MFTQFIIDDLKALGEAWGVQDEGQLRAFSQYYELARIISRIPKKS
jgi:hypothetical protein